MISKSKQFNHVLSNSAHDYWPENKHTNVGNLEVIYWRDVVSLPPPPRSFKILCETVIWLTV